MNELLYQSNRTTIYLGDCADIIDTLPARSVDLIATDPPYGVSWQSNFRSKRFDRVVGDDGTLDVPAVLGAAATSLLRNGRHVYVFGYSVQELYLPMCLGGVAELVWDKNGLTGMGDLSSPWGPAHETITFGVHRKSAANIRDGRGRLSARLRKGSVLRVSRPHSRAVRNHPTEKPVALMRMLIESSSLVDEVVFDPFSGSGSTLVAAIVLGRKAVGIEIDPTYAALSVERVKRAEAIADQLLSL